MLSQQSPGSPGLLLPGTTSSNRAAVAGGEPSALTLTAEAGKKAASRFPRQVTRKPEATFLPVPFSSPTEQGSQIARALPARASETATVRTSLQPQHLAGLYLKLQLFALPKGWLHDLAEDGEGDHAERRKGCRPQLRRDAEVRRASSTRSETESERHPFRNGTGSSSRRAALYPDRQTCSPRRDTPPAAAGSDGELIGGVLPPPAPLPSPGSPSGSPPLLRLPPPGPEKRRR